eukprot:RCo027300
MVYPRTWSPVVTVFFLLCAAASATHSNNWVVIVSTSKYWFNYRHQVNALHVYAAVKRWGIPDDRIILMLAEDVACNSRNPFPAEVYGPGRGKNLHTPTIEVDYRGIEVTAGAFLRLLSDQHPEHFPASRRLLSDENSNVLIFLAGHGGDLFMKFQDSEEVSAQDFADAFLAMRLKRRFHELLLIIDTCQADTLYSTVRTEGIIAVGSSLKDESSYSLSQDPQIGVSVVDRFSHYLAAFMSSADTKTTVAQLLSSFRIEALGSTVGHRADLISRPLSEVLLHEFFGDNATWIAWGHSLRSAAVDVESLAPLRKNTFSSSLSACPSQLLRKPPAAENSLEFSPALAAALALLASWFVTIWFFG